MSFKDTLKGTRRFGEFCNILIKYESKYFIEKDLSIWGRRKKTEPHTIRLILEEMGGGFIKLGQLLSLRPDLIPHEYCLELSKLQDSVKPFSFTEAKQIIEKSAGKKLNEIFSEFYRFPIASASVGQVYKARLKTGEKVAVKVKRPDADEVFAKDIALMESVAKLVNMMHSSDILDPEGIVEEFKTYTADELNYDVERQRLDSFRNSLKNSGVKIPLTFPEYSSKDVLIMEFIEGHPLKNLMEEKGYAEYKKKISIQIFHCFLQQVMVNGEFHADPHPSNIFLTFRGEEKIALLDFGITGSLSTIMKANIVKLFISLNNKDMEGVITAMMHMNMIASDDKEIRADMRNMLSPYYGAGLKKIDFPKLFLQSIKVARKHKIKVPKDYVLLGKAVLTVESVCAGLYPEFNFVEESKPFVAKLMLHEYSPTKFLADQFSKARDFEGIIQKLPLVVSQLFNGNPEQNKKVEELAVHLTSAEHRIDVLLEKMLLMFITLIAIISGFLLLNVGPKGEGISVLSICLFCIAAATLLLAVMIKSRK